MRTRDDSARYRPLTSPVRVTTRNGCSGGDSQQAGPRAAYHRCVERFDALVVGAGPAGSATSLHIARSGARVLLVDKARFPRDKPCGGGLTGRALRHVPCDVEPVVERVVERMVMRVGYRAMVARTSAKPLIAMTQRRRLDLHLAEQAAAAGADFRDGTALADLALGKDGVTARIGGSRVEASFLVGADGANGVVCRVTGVGAGIVRGVALEGNVGWDELERRRYERAAWVELGVVPGVSEGRSRESRRRRLDGRGTTASRPPRAVGTRSRGRPGGDDGHTRPQASDA